MAWNIETSRRTDPDLEILVHQVSVDVAASIVIDASSVASDPVTGERKLVAGTPMTKNANNQYQEWTGATGLTVQTVSHNGTGGAFTLTHRGNTTAGIAFDAVAATVEAALEALPSIGDVEVTGAGTAADPYIVTFVNIGEAAALTGSGAGLTPAGSTVTIGNSGAGTILGILSRTEVFPDGTSRSDLPSAMWNHGQWFRADRIKGWAANQNAIRSALPTCKFS